MEKEFEFLVFDTENNSSYIQEEFGKNIVDAIDNQATAFWKNTSLLKVRHTHDNVLELTHKDKSISYLVYTPTDTESYWGINKHSESHPRAEHVELIDKEEKELRLLEKMDTFITVSKKTIKEPEDATKIIEKIIFYLPSEIVEENRLEGESLAYLERFVQDEIKDTKSELKFLKANLA